MKKALTIPIQKIAFIFIFTVICSAYLYAGNTHKTDSLENLLKKVNEKQKAKLLNELAGAYFPNQPNKIMEYAKSAFILAKKQNNREEEATALKLIGIALYYQSRYEEALKYYNNSVHIFKELDNKSEIAKLLNNIGIIYQEFNVYKIALEYYQESLKFGEEINDKYGIANTLNNIGIVYNKLKIYEDALVYYYKSLKINKEINDKKGISYSLNNIGITYLKLNNYEDALKYYQKSLKIKEEIFDKRGVAITLNNIGNLYNKLGNFSEALLYFDKSFEMAKSLDTKDIIIDNYKSFSESYSAMAKYKKSLKYYKQYTALKDSVFNLETYKQIADMKTKYETEKKEKEIQELKYKTKIQQTKINYHKKTQIIYFTGLLLALIAITLILIQYKKKNNAYKFLVKKNINLLNKEKEFKDFREQKIANKPDNNKKITVTDNLKEDILNKLTQLLDNEKIFKNFDFSTEKLAKQLQTNNKYLSIVINEEFGINYIDFINEYRIKESMLLLSDPNKNLKLSISGIAEESGFKSLSCFYKVFKEYTGITPSKFKQKAIAL